MVIRALTIVLTVALLVQAPVAAQKVYDVRLIQQDKTDLYRFEPSQVTAQAGDILQFTLVSGGPYLVAFEPSDFLGPSKARMIGAIPGNNPEMRAPALAKVGDRFRVTLPALPAGRYRFYSVTHVAYRMAGSLVVR